MPSRKRKLLWQYSTTFPRLSTNYRILPQAETPIFLGATLDSRLSWKPQIESMRKRGIQKLALLKRLSGTHGGASPRILKTVYTGTVRPTLEYGASECATAAKTYTTNSTKYRTWAMKSTPKATMQKTTGVEPLVSRRNAKLLTHGENVKRMSDHPLHKRVQDLTKNRLKRTSLNHVLKEQQMKQSDILASRPEECEKLTHNRTKPKSDVCSNYSTEAQTLFTATEIQKTTPYEIQYEV